MKIFKVPTARTPIEEYLQNKNNPRVGNDFGSGCDICDASW
ncbi:MAG: hypothetical protein V3V14_08540 [Saprospiraceae bacterium]